MTGTEVYWLLKLDDIRNTLQIVVAFSAIGAIASIFVCITTESIAPFIKYIKIIGIPLLAAILLATFIPSTKQMAVIIIVPAVVNNEQVQQIPQKVLDILDLSLDELKKSVSEDE